MELAQVSGYLHHFWRQKNLTNSDVFKKYIQVFKEKIMRFLKFPKMVRHPKHFLSPFQPIMLVDTTFAKQSGILKSEGIFYAWPICSGTLIKVMWKPKF